MIPSEDGNAVRSSDSAGVWFPPPLIYALGLLVAWLLSRYVAPWHVNDSVGAPIVRYSYCIVFLSIGILIVLWAGRTFHRAGTSTLPMLATTRIVESGPYQLTRNPMYVAFAFIYLGIGTLVAWGWSLVLLPVVIATIYLYVIRREERYLSAKFGQEYLEYKKRVRRWI